MNFLISITSLILCFASLSNAQIECFTYKDPQDKIPYPKKCNNTLAEKSLKVLREHDMGYTSYSITIEPNKQTKNEDDTFECFYLELKKPKLFKYVGCIKKNYLACSKTQIPEYVDDEDINCIQCTQDLCNAITKTGRSAVLHTSKGCILFLISIGEVLNKLFTRI